MINWPWVAVFVPLLYVLYHITFVPIIYEALRARLDDSLYYPLTRSSFLAPVGFAILWFSPLESSDKNFERIVHFTPVASVVTFVALLLVKLMEIDVELPWRGVLLPLLLFWIFRTVYSLISNRDPSELASYTTWWLGIVS